VVSLSGYRWFVSFIDDFSQTTWVYWLKEKSDVFSVFQMFYKMVQTQFNTMIKIVHYDNGGKYMSGNLEAYFREQLSTKPRVLILRSKMVWLNRKIGTC